MSELDSLVGIRLSYHHTSFKYGILVSAATDTISGSSKLNTYPRFTRSMRHLKHFHWLPVRYRIIFKICSISYQAVFCKQPSH